MLCFGILVWNLKNYVGVDESASCGHEFDGIEEINNPMPRWWVIMFFVCFAWAAVYLLFYPGLGNWQGLFNWTSSNQGVTSLAQSKQAVIDAEKAGLYVQLDQQIAEANAQYAPLFAELAKLSVEEILLSKKQGDEAEALVARGESYQPSKGQIAWDIGQRLFQQNCAQCHGADARGYLGFPNLADNDWLYGGSPEKIKETLLHGRIAAMPGWKSALGEQGIKEMTAYVLSLSGRTVNQKDAAAGQSKFGMCAACHGADGKGSVAHNLSFGAPNLTDNIWLYGGSQRAVQQSLEQGRAGVMPPWKDILGEDKVHLLTAYVYSLSQPQ